ncbi:MAG TPA: hypothetical protein VM282_02300 [Acidimicrobiales bacterium]|nr:hypothetical protein [Acidimicrobiales bacterium]
MGTRGRRPNEAGVAPMIELVMLDDALGRGARPRRRRHAATGHQRRGRAAAGG